MILVTFFFYLQEMCQRPRFRSQGTQVSEVDPGELGDMCLSGALSSLTLTPYFLERVVPMDQGFDTTAGYCGIFR